MKARTARACAALAAATCGALWAPGAGADEPGEPGGGPARRFALVAAANDGGTDRVPLRFAVSDAHAVVEVLEALGGVAPGDRELLVEPRRDALLGALDALAPRMAGARTAGRVELVFYYSGHSDEEGLLLGGERVGYAELRARIEALPADVRVAILDSCASGAFTRRKGGRFRPPFATGAAADVKGHAFLTSASLDEAAQESDLVGGSFFTHFLVSGLRGAADVSRDGRVTLGEAYQHAFHETLARTERTRTGPQHAAYDIGLVGSGDLVLTDLRGAGSALVLAEELKGRVHVRDGERRLVVELQKRLGPPVELALPPGAYDVLVERDGERGEARVVLARGGREELAPGMLAPVAALEPTAVRGGATPVSALRAGEGGRDAGLGVWLAPGIGLETGGRHRLSLGLLGARAPSIEGVQLSPVNLSGDVAGVQLGAVNVAGEVSGLQLGLVNVSREADVTLGLVNVVERGVLAADVWVTEWPAAFVGVKSGGRLVYTIVAAGLAPSEGMGMGSGMGSGAGAGRPLVGPLLGAGHRTLLAPGLALDADVLGGPAELGASGGTGAAVTARAVVVYALGDHLALLAGAQVTGRTASGGADPAPAALPALLLRDGELALWPGLVLGAELGTRAGTRDPR